MHCSLARLYRLCILLPLAAVPFAAAQTEIVLHAFQSGSHFDGANPEGALIADSNARSTARPPMAYVRLSTVFKLSPSGTQNILYSFTSAPMRVAGRPLYLDPRVTSSTEQLLAVATS